MYSSSIIQFVEHVAAKTQIHRSSNPWSSRPDRMAALLRWQAAGIIGPQARGHVVLKPMPQLAFGDDTLW